MPCVHSTSNNCDAHTHSAHHVQVFHHTLPSTLHPLLNLSEWCPLLSSQLVLLNSSSVSRERCRVVTACGCRRCMQTSSLGKQWVQCKSCLTMMQSPMVGLYHRWAMSVSVTVPQRV